MLAPQLRAWVDAHLIAPREVRLSVDPYGTSFTEVWLVTDHTEVNDSNYRIVYDREWCEFGLERTMDNGVEWYMGTCGSFAKTVEKM